MNLIPAIVIPANAPYTPSQDDLDVAYRLAHDTSIVFARKMGGSASLPEATIVVRCPPVNTAADLNVRPDSDTTWPTVRAACAEAATDVVLAFLYARILDMSGRGARADGTVGTVAFSPPPTQGGLALLGWGNILSAQRGLFTRPLPADRANYRLDYGIPLGQCTHEVGHGCGLDHPAMLNQGDTIMGYALAEFATGDPKINPLLFTNEELAALTMHPLFANVVWQPMLGMEGIDVLTAKQILAGTYEAKYALGLGMTLKEFGI